MNKKLAAALLSMTLLITACGNKKSDTALENTGKEIKVGVIQFADHVALDRSRQGFIDKLERDNYKVNADIVNCQGDLSVIPATVKKFQDDKVDVIYAIATPAAQGAKNMVKDIPIIFNAVTDPVKADLVKSTEKPEANVTGVSDYFSVEQQLNKFREIFPNTKSLGLIYSTGEQNSEAQIKELEKITDEKGIKLNAIGVNTTNDVPQAMASLTQKIDSYVAIQDNLASSAANIISQKLIESKIPSFAGEEGPVENGMLMSDGVDYFKLGQEAGKMAEEIKEGKEIKDIPVFFTKDATRTVNKQTATELGLRDDKKLFENAKTVER